jgi:acyl-CoA thioester hydrolase
VNDGAGPLHGPLHGLEFRLAFGECDPAGIVYYATYLEWAERVHGDWWYLQGRPIGDPASRPSFVVRHVSCDYLSPPRVNDLLRCDMSLQRVGRTSFTLSFRFTMVGSGEHLAELWFTAVFVDEAGDRCEVPDEARRLLQGADAPA